MAEQATDGAASGAPAGAELASYEVVRQRLVTRARELGERAERLNTARQEAFGTSALAMVAHARIRTEHNCVPRDIVSVGGAGVGGALLFGYHVELGLRSETTPADVFSLHRFVAPAGGPATEAVGDGEAIEAGSGDGWDLSQVPLTAVPGLFDSDDFQRHFRELFEYTKGARLVHLKRSETQLLAVFRTGTGDRDLRVFRWRIDPEGRPTYVDNRGERDYVFPASHDFEWVRTTRDDQVSGRHPHVNVLDTVFVETVGGDLTLKVEDNTDSGEGVYSEPVEDANQSLDDADIAYAKLGPLILLRIQPFREPSARYLVFNTRSRDVQRFDAIGQACVQLPEDQGILFPGGYYLSTGEWKVFDAETDALEFKRKVAAPNGEDVLYVFYQRASGRYVLLPYNLIAKAVASPIQCHGHALFPDGTMPVFRARTDEPTRVHPLQIWATPFVGAEVHAAQAAEREASGLLGRIGNADLVRGISDALTLRRMVEAAEPSRKLYEDLIAHATRVLDAYWWLAEAGVGDLREAVEAVRATAEGIVDEFDKVVALRAQAEAALAQAIERHGELTSRMATDQRGWRTVDKYLVAFDELRTHRGQLATLHEVRYMVVARLGELEAEADQVADTIGRACVDFLRGGEAFGPLMADLADLLGKVEAVSKTSELAALTERIETTSRGLDTLTEVVGGLEVDDPTARTEILESTSEVYGHLNRVRAALDGRRRSLGEREAQAEFAAQFRLFAQALQSAVALSDTPERCDAELARLLVQVEELEARFGEHEAFLAPLAEKRDEVYEALGAKKQALMDKRQRRVDALMAAAERILSGLGRRAKAFTDEEALQAFFASDPMVVKLRKLQGELGDLGDGVKADDVGASLKAARQEALRALRDRADLFEAGAEGGQLVRLGRHRFTVNEQGLELTVVPRGDGLAVHLTGTQFYEAVTDPGILDYRDQWDRELPSEGPTVARAEFLAGSILLAAEASEGGLTVEALQQARTTPAEDPREPAMLPLVRELAGKRLDEGYERGVHDRDAARILETLVDLRDGAGRLRHTPDARALAALFWAESDVEIRRREGWRKEAASVVKLRQVLGAGGAVRALARRLAAEVEAFVAEHDLDPERFSGAMAAEAGQLLVEELALPTLGFATSQAAEALTSALGQHLRAPGVDHRLTDDLEVLRDEPAGVRFRLAEAWLTAFVQGVDSPAANAALEAGAAHVVAEASAWLVTGSNVPRDVTAARTRATVDGLLGHHATLGDGKLELQLDAFLARVGRHVREEAVRWRAYKDALRRFLDRERKALRLDAFQPRVLSSFVRNRLIDEVYLPLVGDNLAKQLGAVGAQKRTDLMGLLLLVSPPGYGKTTLMEYVASRLGLVFVKANGPALGHDVTSLDPSDAPNATSRLEVDKINLAFEMGHNVMLYLDDIQHTSPELLQKFISLCDGQRRIEGVWRGETKTYDLRGRKFCVVMAGNPYTESGETFRIPDMLSNRADTYNLGEVLHGKGDVFALSYVENSLTSNPVTAPLAMRDRKDVHLLARRAAGEDVATTDLSHDYSRVELDEVTAVLRHLLACRDVLLAVNGQYVASAAQEDASRTEPPFKLQGSYRNMNKLSEKLVPAMTPDEVQALVDDHYRGEAQTLTTEAEQNLLKLAELRGRLTPEQATRWAEIKATFVRQLRLGGGEDDPALRVVRGLGDVGEALAAIRGVLDQAAAHLASRADVGEDSRALAVALEGLQGALATVAKPELDLRVALEAPARDGATPSDEQALRDQLGLLKDGLLPLVRAVETRVVHSPAAAAAVSAEPGRLAEMDRQLDRVEALVASLDSRLKKGLRATIVQKPAPPASPGPSTPPAPAPKPKG